MKTEYKPGGATVPLMITWDPSIKDAGDVVGFIADRPYRVASIVSRIAVAGTDAGAVTAVVRKAGSGTAIGLGTALHTGTIDLKGTANANATATLSGTASDLDIPTGTAIGLDLTGDMASARGVVAIQLVAV